MNFFDNLWQINGNSLIRVLKNYPLKKVLRVLCVLEAISEQSKIDFSLFTFHFG